MGWVRANEIDLYHELHGAGPPVLAISGTGGDLRRNPASLSPLNHSFRTLAYDQRGLGQTSKPDAAYTMADYADDAAALIAAVGWDRCHVVGTSFGGMVALELALRHPGLVDRLVLCCTSPGGEAASYPLHELEGRDADEAREMRLRLLDQRWDPDADEPIPGLGALYPVIAQYWTTGANAESAAGLRRQLMARAAHDVVDRLGEIAHETLICAGIHDALAPIENAELMADRMPNSVLRRFDGGHLFMIQDPTAYPAIVAFLTGGHAALPESGGEGLS